MATLTRCACGSGRRAKHWIGRGMGAVIVCDECHQLGENPLADHHLLDQLQRAVGEGLTMRQAARRLKLPLGRLARLAADASIVFDRGQRSGLYRMSVAADLLGVPRLIFRDWVQRGEVAAIRRGRAVWIGHEALLAFLERPERWMLWQPERIADPALADWTRSLRAAAGWRWLSAVEAGRALGYSCHSVRDFVRAGWLPATLVRKAYWLRSDLVERAHRHLHLLPYRTPADERARLRLQFRAAIGAPLDEAADEAA